jgi:hypothetical protein
MTEHMKMGVSGKMDAVIVVVAVDVVGEEGEEGDMMMIRNAVEIMDEIEETDGDSMMTMVHADEVAVTVTDSIVGLAVMAQLLEGTICQMDHLITSLLDRP